MRQLANAVRALGICTFLAVTPALAVETPTAAVNCDCNGDGDRDISDASYLFSWLFLGGDPPAPLVVNGEPAAIDNGNCNGDGDRDISDGIYLLAWLFLGGPAPAGEPAAPTTYAGSLTPTRGRWSYQGTLGLAGAEAECESLYPGTSVCTFESLQEAAAAGELAGATDPDGTTVVSFWIHEPDAPDDRRCVNPPDGVGWTYQTGHLAVDGEFVPLSEDGALGEVGVQRACQGLHWVACCRTAP